MRKCRAGKPCDGVEQIHEKEPGKKGLQVTDTVNVKTGKRSRRIGYREKWNGPMIWLNFCPWCGFDWWKK